MVRCGNCGVENDQDAKYCKNCGNELEGASQQDSSGGTQQWEDEDSGETGTQVWGQKTDPPVDWQNNIGMKFKLISAGEFMMGSDKWDDSQPVHKVKITEPFYMGVYPVTQREWKAVMGNNPSEFKGDDLPVESVSWADCQRFIRKLNSRENGHEYRLPTEAEWEHACRAGSEGRYCFGDDEGRLSKYAWYRANSNKETHPVGKKRPNRFGLHNMHGSVWEWCEDWVDRDYYERSPKVDPKGPKSGSYRVIRGGNWSSVTGGCTSANRNYRSPDSRIYLLGFRLVRSV